MPKGVEKLSRRLHHFKTRRNAGFFFMGGRVLIRQAGPVNSLSPEEAAYLAGLIDADGSVTLTRRHRNENRHATVSISNTDRSLLRFALTVIGAGKVTNKRATGAHHRPSFTYSIANRQAVSLLVQVAPHLRTYKALRARLIIDNYIALTPRNGKYSGTALRDRRRFEEAVLALGPAGSGASHR